MNPVEIEKIAEPVAEAVQKSEKRRNTDGEADLGTVRIKLPSAVGARSKEIVAELRARGAQISIDDLLFDYIEAIPEKYFEAQLLQRTPGPYYLEAATKIPELREILIRQAKKGLLRVSPDSHLSKKTRRHRRKRSEGESQVTGEKDKTEVSEVADAVD